MVSVCVSSFFGCPFFFKVDKKKNISYDYKRWSISKMDEAKLKEQIQ